MPLQREEYLRFQEPERVFSNGSTNRPFECTEHRTSYKCEDDRFYAPPCDSINLSSFEIGDYKSHTDKAATLYIRPDRLVMAHRGPDLFDLYVQFDLLVFRLCK